MVTRQRKTVAHKESVPNASSPNLTGPGLLTWDWNGGVSHWIRYGKVLFVYNLSCRLDVEWTSIQHVACGSCKQNWSDLPHQPSSREWNRLTYLDYVDKELCTWTVWQIALLYLNTLIKLFSELKDRVCAGDVYQLVLGLRFLSSSCW